MRTPEEAITLAAADARAEALAASDKYPPFNSCHEGWAVLREEVDELWDEVKLKPALRDPTKLRLEAIQVAAMALRFAAECCGGRR